MRLLSNNDDGDDDDDSTPKNHNLSYNDTEVLCDTLIVYGTLLLLMALVFVWARRRFPKVYSLKRWIGNGNGNDQYASSNSSDASIMTTSGRRSDEGYWSWVSDMYNVQDDEILRAAGMDALCFIRIARFGYQLSLVGMFNALWLVFVYGTAPKRSDTEDIDDFIVKISIAHVPNNGAWPRFLSAIVAAYIFFGAAMWMVLRDFAWYTHMRHEHYLQSKVARNYTVFIRNIPPSCRNNRALEQFMKSCFSNDSVLEARVAVTTNQLAKLQEKRNAVLTKLEHALAEYEDTNRRPTHREGGCFYCLVGNTVDSIEIYQQQLTELNDQVNRDLTNVEDKIAAMMSTASEYNARSGLSSGATGEDGHDERTALLSPEHASEMKHPANNTLCVPDTVGQVMGGAFQTVGDFATDAVDGATRLISGKDDGIPHPAGFVVFSKLSTANAALQMVHHPTPFSMQISEAPDPKDIKWVNISRTHKSLELGKVSSLGMTVGLCFLYTIPISFIATLSSVDGLRKQVAFVDHILNAAPFLVPVFEILAPLLLVIANSMLPTILETITLFEGPISGAVVQASLFAKLAAFMIIQTFFVSAISGSIIAKLEQMLESPKLIVDVLAKTLPAQSTYFIQISFVSVIVQGGMELLRIVPAVMAFLRSFIGPRLTEKERRATYMGLRPLNNPPKFSQAYFCSQAVLYFMVLLVYSIIAPVTNFVLAFCFLFLEAMLRHQFLYVYPNVPDSGGKIWSNFIKIFLSCMLVAQITMLGLFGLKKAKIASPCLVPLVIITAMFSFYIRQEHFRVAEFLPTPNCLREDLRRTELDLSFLQGAYLQPEVTATRQARPTVNTDSGREGSGDPEGYQELT